MDAKLQDVSDLIQNPAFWVAVAWLASELWRGLKRSLDRSGGAVEAVKISLMSELKACTKQMSDLTNSIVRLEVKFDHIERLALSIPKMQKDINVLHERVRALRDDPPA